MTDIKKISGIYCIENTVNHKKYIGQSVNIKERWRKHRKELYANKHNNDYLQISWNKYGKISFKFYILEECDITSLDERENYYINYFNTLNRDYGYNLKTGGQNGGAIVSNEVRKKISAAVKKSYNKELIELRRQNALSYWSNPDNKKNIFGENNGMYGKKHSEESKSKMSKNRKGVVAWNKSNIPILCIELNKTFVNVTEAGKEMKLDSSAINKVCKGQRHTCGGYHWQYINNGEIK